MPKKATKTFTEKELEIMRIIWECGEATTKRIQERLPGTPHYNNVLTIVRVLEKKGHITHREEGRAFVYKPKESKEKAQRRVLDHLVKQVFGGSASSLVLNLVEAGELTKKDLDDIRQSLDLGGKAEEE